MDTFVKEIVRKYGILTLIIFSFIIALSIWFFAHRTAAPGSQISILWGMVVYTKIGDSTCSEEKKLLIESWGVQKSTNSLTATINTALIKKFADKYNMLLICRVKDDTVDLNEDTKIFKSNLFSITGNKTDIAITVNGMDYEQKIQFHLCLLPIGIEADGIKRISDVKALGGIASVDLRGVTSKSVTERNKK